MHGTESGKRDLRYIIMGAGMAGILAAIRLKEAGRNNFVIYEKGSGISGTWHENRYPGLTCDVPAHAYTYSFAPNPDWSSFFAPGPEIRNYFEDVAEKFGVMSSIQLNSEVVSARFNEKTHRWDIRLKDGREDSGDVIIAATGVLHHPSMPPIEGIDNFRGKIFHSTRWDDEAPLDGARVGIIGTGSTGVQIVSALSKRAKELVHFIRTPQWIMAAPNIPYTDEERETFRRQPELIDAIRYGDDYLQSVGRFNTAIIHPDSPEMAEIQRLVEENLEQSVRDPELREKLRPDYMAACKRLIYSPDYYEAVQRPGVSVERTDIARIVPEGVELVDGRVIEFDTIVLATGFRVDRFMRPMEVLGRNGADLEKFWDKRATAYLAVTMPDFPNFFMLNGPTGPVGNFSLIDIAERQWGYISPFLDMLESGGAVEVAPTGAAMETYEKRRIEAAKKTVFGSGCISWYLDAEGVPATWPWSYEDFGKAMASPVLADFDIRMAADA